MLIPPKIIFTLFRSLDLSSFFLIVESQNSALTGLRWSIFWGTEGTILQNAVGEILLTSCVGCLSWLGPSGHCSPSSW